MITSRKQQEQISNITGVHAAYQMNTNKTTTMTIKTRINKLKMTQQFSLIVVVVVLCLSIKAPRAFVSADDDLETTTSDFGELCCAACY